MYNKNLFNSIQLKRPKKSSFDLSHDVKLTASMGNLTPILTLECVPGDKFNLSCESLIRFAPLVSPVMHRMDVTMHYFFVPNRLVWNQWEEFITNPNSGIVHPFLSVGNWSPPLQKFADYMGVPPNNSNPAVLGTINPIPFAAYQCIYNEYYRDQNLIQPIDCQLQAGENAAKTINLATIRKRAWEHDYFTSALPFAQKGQPVDIPLGSVNGNADIYQQVNPAAIDLTGNPQNLTIPNGSPDGAQTNMFAETKGLEIDPTTINDLRRAFKLQEWLERNARGGTRYIENILSHFGVRSSDSRLQRPEYITGIKSPVTISEVLNTTGSFEASDPTKPTSQPQGSMAGHGVAITSGKAGSYYCEEHGYIIGIMSILPRTAYQQGIPRHYSKMDSLDYYWPTFANIGEQEVKNKEIYAYTANANDTFGYVPRYAEYKYMPSRVAGDFRTTLDFWHLGRIFANQPALNQQFIECDPASTTRIFAVEDGTDPLYCHVYNKIQAIRPMPKFGTPQF